MLLRHLVTCNNRCDWSEAAQVGGTEILLLVIIHHWKRDGAGKGQDLDLDLEPDLDLDLDLEPDLDLDLDLDRLLSFYIH